ncbi:MAG TPA: serine/threonine-protein kinase, partial [Rhodocyclaceae bacterium]
MSDALTQIAASVSDGEDIDWQSLLETTDEPATLANLKIVALLADSLKRLDEPPAPASWGGLDVRSRIDGGAYADVYKAYDAALDREVALKLYRHAEGPRSERLLAEGKLLARVDHPNVVRVHGAAQHDGVTGLWMECIDGESLQDRIIAGQTPSGREAAVTGLDIARGLAGIHAAGVIHGDIKAANVLRDDKGRIRIADFGSGFDIESAEQAIRVSGTPLYLAPEVLDGQPPSVASDIYSLGVLMFFLLSGRYPREAGSIDELRAAPADARHHLRDLRPDLDDELQRIVERCLADDPGSRPRSAGEAAEALSAYLGGAAPQRAVFDKRQWIAAAVATVVLISLILMRSPGYSLDVELLVSADGRPAVSVADGGVVGLGDSLQLALASDKPLYVYVFSESGSGESWGLFPLPALGLDNPVAAADARRLPGDGWSWLVSHPAATETIHLVASPSPVAELESAYAGLPPAEQSGAFASRGIGRVV